MKQMDIIKLARDFSQEMQNQLTADQIDHINIANAAETNRAICHSHDFCDANQLMLDAMANQDVDFDVLNDMQAFEIQAAWNLAKSVEFNPLARYETL